jgi:hypothetical protein
MSSKTIKNSALSIRDLAPQLAYHLIDIDNNQLVYEAYQRLIAENANQIGIFCKYIGRLHDCGILSSMLSEKNFSITLNDFSTHIFADIIVEKVKLNIPQCKLVFPIQIDFVIDNLSYNTVDDEGFIHRIEPTSITEYLYEEIISINQGKIELGIVAWKNDNQEETGQYILILLSAKSISVYEQQASAWREIFGNCFDAHYSYFRTQFENGRYLGSQSIAYELFDEVEMIIKGR